MPELVTNLRNQKARHKEMKKKHINIEKIETQVERWDLFARLVPTVFLIINLVLVTTGIINFEQAFWVGLGLFALTAVTWWFWTIYTIRHLVKTLNRATKNLGEVRDEFKSVSQDLEAYKNDIK
jgi:hypothetical protein